MYAAVSIALPLQAGRDLPRYLLVYAQLFDAHVVFPNALLARTPGTPVVAGLLLEGGPVVSEAGLAVLYALSVVAWFCVARRFGPVAALTTAAALLAYPGYVLLFHELASDALFAAAFALVALLLARAVEHPTMARAGGLGLGVVALVLARPVGQVLLLLGLAPLLAARGRRPRVEAVGAFAVAAIVAARRARRRSTRACGRLHRRPRRVGVAPLPHVRRGPHRRARQRRGVRRARAGGVARAAPARAVPVARDRPRDVLLVGQLADARRPDRALRQDVGLGRRLPPPRPRRARGDPRAPGSLCARRREGHLAPAPLAALRAGRDDGIEPVRRRVAAGRAGACRTRDRRRADPVVARSAVHLHAGRADPRGVDVADRAFDRVPLPGRRAPARPRSTAR